MNRTWVPALVVAAFISSTSASGGSTGVSTVCRNADCVVSASSSLFSVALAVALAVFLVVYRQREYAVDAGRVVGVWRRFGAFLLDYVLALTIVSPLATLPLLVAEAKYTGTFAWAFVRDHSRPTDSMYLDPGLVAAFAVLFYYFYQHARLGRPTAGQYALSYRVTASPGGKPRYALRVLFSFLGLCVWPVSVILALRNPEKAFWWDTATQTKVERVVS